MKSVTIEQTNLNDSQNESTKKSTKKKLSLKAAKSHAYKLIEAWVKEKSSSNC